MSFFSVFDYIQNWNAFLALECWRSWSLISVVTGELQLFAVCRVKGAFAFVPSECKYPFKPKRKKKLYLDCASIVIAFCTTTTRAKKKERNCLNFFFQIKNSVVFAQLTLLSMNKL